MDLYAEGTYFYFQSVQSGSKGLLVNRRTIVVKQVAVMFI